MPGSSQSGQYQARRATLTSKKMARTGPQSSQHFQLQERIESALRHRTLPKMSVCNRARELLGNEQLGELVPRRAGAEDTWCTSVLCCPAGLLPDGLCRHCKIQPISCRCLEMGFPSRFSLWSFIHKHENGRSSLQMRAPVLQRPTSQLAHIFRSFLVASSSSQEH